MTPAQKSAILHALGDSHPNSPLGWRDHYCAAEGDHECEAMVEVGLMLKGNTINGGRDRYYFANREHPDVIALIEGHGNAKHKAFAITYQLAEECVSYYADETAGKARYKIWRDVSDVWDRVKLVDFKVRRAPELDGRAKRMPRAGVLV